MIPNLYDVIADSLSVNFTERYIIYILFFLSFAYSAFIAFHMNSAIYKLDIHCDYNDSSKYPTIRGVCVSLHIQHCKLFHCFMLLTQSILMNPGNEDAGE